MFEKEIIINGDNPIYGTLALPASAGEFPTVLILPGSGPIDRNGNDRKGKFQTNLYKDIAHFITNLGFATFRYDKRGTGKSDGDWVATGLSDLIEDAKRAMTFLSSSANVDETKIIVCGHSEGTIHATAIAESMNPAGVMFLAGGVDNLMDALRKQRLLAYQELCEMPGITGWLNRKLNVAVKNEQKYDKLMKKMQETDKDVVKIALFFKQPAKYYREHNVFNTRNALQNVTCPVFALQDDKDALVDNEVLNELSQLVQGKSEFHIIPNMEHALRTQPEPKSILKAKKLYKELFKRPLNEVALKKIANWLVTSFMEDPILNKNNIENVMER